jgi:hypothetical protein
MITLQAESDASTLAQIGLLQYVLISSTDSLTRIRRTYRWSTLATTDLCPEASPPVYKIISQENHQYRRPRAPCVRLILART